MLSLCKQTTSRSKPSPGNHSVFPNKDGGLLHIVAAFPLIWELVCLSNTNLGRAGASQISGALPNTRGPSLEEEGSSFGQKAPLPERTLAETETTSCAEVSQVMKSRLHGKEAPPTARQPHWWQRLLNPAQGNQTSPQWLRSRVGPRKPWAPQPLGSEPFQFGEPEEGKSCAGET